MSTRQRVNRKVITVFVCGAALALAQETRAESGWVWAHDATASAPYEPSETFSHNSAGGKIRIERRGTGAYVVNFDGLAVSGGNVQVTSYGQSSDYCKVERWSRLLATLQVFVRCFNVSGNAADSRFVAIFTKWTPPGGFWAERGYVWNDLTTTGGTPSRDFQSVYGVGPATVSHAFGETDVRVPIGGNPPSTGERGIALVTAYGGDNRFCHPSVPEFADTGTTAVITVACLAPGVGGAQVSRFSLSYGRYAPVEAPTVGYAAILNAASHTVPANRSGMVRAGCRSLAGDVTVTRHAVGRYTVRFPAISTIGTKSAAMVSSIEFGHCRIGSWGSDGSGGTNVNVNCVGTSGRALDGHFNVALATTQGCID